MSHPTSALCRISFSWMRRPVTSVTGTNGTTLIAQGEQETILGHGGGLALLFGKSSASPPPPARGPPWPPAPPPPPAAPAGGGTDPEETIWLFFDFRTNPRSRRKHIRSWLRAVPDGAKKWQNTLKITVHRPIPTRSARAKYNEALSNPPVPIAVAAANSRNWALAIMRSPLFGKASASLLVLGPARRCARPQEPARRDRAASKRVTA